jgi:hypothetical protein
MLLLGRDECPYKRGLEELPCSFHNVRKWHGDNKSDDIFILDFTASRPLRNKFLLFKRYSAYGILLNELVQYLGLFPIVSTC